MTGARITRRLRRVTTWPPTAAGRCGDAGAAPSRRDDHRPPRPVGSRNHPKQRRQQHAIGPRRPRSGRSCMPLRDGELIRHHRDSGPRAAGRPWPPMLRQIASARHAGRRGRAMHDSVPNAGAGTSQVEDAHDSSWWRTTLSICRRTARALVSSSYFL
jgi:hypothetical protein